VVVGHVNWVRVTTPAPLGNVADVQAVPLASVNTPALELVVSRAKHGIAVLGQVIEPTDVRPAGTVSFTNVAPFADEHSEPAVALQ
jgi:hypothetical protein